MHDDDTTSILQRVIAAVGGIDGIVAVVLGGSLARGTHDDDSDIDIGLYYDSTAGLDVARLAVAAQALDDEKRADLIAPPGSWGNWVDGGGWLTMDGRQVDLILRDVNRVEKAIDDCLAGKVTAHYQTGHPHAYLNVMYMGELAVCRILYDCDDRMRSLQKKTRPYPEVLRNALLSLFGFEAGFSVMLAEKNARRNDVYYVAAHLARSVSCMNQVLFALNREYCLNEKKAVRMADAFPLKPDAYQSRVERLFSALGDDPARACGICRELVDEIAVLAENA